MPQFSPQRVLLSLVYGTPSPVISPFDPSKIRKILVIRRNGFGDMICALPLLRNLKSAWPHAQIDILAGEKNGVVLDGLKLVHKIHRYTRGRGIFRNHYLHLHRVLSPIRAENYDLLIVVKAGFSPLLGVIAWATRIPWRLGYIPSRGHPLDFCLNLTINLPMEREHQVRSCMRLLQPLGIPPGPLDFSLHFTSDHHHRANELLNSAKLVEKRFAIFNLSSERYESRWLPEAAAQTALELEKRHHLRTLLCGLPQDRAFMEQIRKRAPSAIAWIAEPPSLHDFAALTQRARFLLCGDGGPMHVAAATSTPALVLFSATDPEIWKPLGIPFEFVQRSRFVADIPASEVLEKLMIWLPTLQANA